MESTDFSGDYHASNVLQDGCTDTTLAGRTTFWIAPQRATGLNAHFIVELGCRTVVDHVTLRQTSSSVNR